MNLLKKLGFRMEENVSPKTEENTPELKEINELISSLSKEIQKKLALLAEQEKLNMKKYSTFITVKILEDLNKYPIWEWENSYGSYTNDNVKYSLYMACSKMYPSGLSAALTDEDGKLLYDTFTSAQDVYFSQLSKKQFEKDLTKFLKNNNIDEI